MAVLKHSRRRYRLWLAYWAVKIITALALLLQVVAGMVRGR